MTLLEAEAAYFAFYLLYSQQVSGCGLAVGYGGRYIQVRLAKGQTPDLPETFLGLPVVITVADTGQPHRA